MNTLIIDNYDSFTYNLYQYFGELGGNPRVVRNDKISIEETARQKYSHIVLSPGPGSPDDPNYFGVCRSIILNVEMGIPILGVCLGHQGIISAFGGKIIRNKEVKHGKTSVMRHNGKGIFLNVPSPLTGMRYHSLVGDTNHIPADLEVTATSCDDLQVMGVAHKKYPIYGVQFHPESIGTENGKMILQNFLNI